VEEMVHVVTPLEILLAVIVYLFIGYIHSAICAVYIRNLKYNWFAKVYPIVDYFAEIPPKPTDYAEEEFIMFFSFFAWPIYYLGRFLLALIFWFMDFAENILAPIFAAPINLLVKITKPKPKPINNQPS
jgi:hypothetical protein